MNKIPNPTTTALYLNQNPWVLLLITLGATMVGFQFVGAFLGLAVAFPAYPGNLTEFTSALLDPTSDENMRLPLLIMQGIGSFTGFILIPWVLLKFLYNGSISSFSSKKTSVLLLFSTLLITILFMVVNAPFIEWNQNLKLPEALSGLESALRTMEDALAETSSFITKFTGLGQLLLGILVVAVIPGIGEELVFRGLVQNHVFRISRNIHIAIWTGALLFSLFHLQFYGLIPRMFLGALFGYLYYFSGNIIYPMVAHFFNNGFTLVMLYLYQQEIVEYNIEDSDILPWPQIVFSAGILLVLFILFRKRAANEELGESI